MSTDELMSGLPGEALVRQGLADFQSGRRTIPACLIAMARTRLSDAGLLDRASVSPFVDAEPERELYRMLGREEGDAYSRYNALVRELVSFNSALDRRRSKLATDL